MADGLFQIGRNNPIQKLQAGRLMWIPGKVLGVLLTDCYKVKKKKSAYLEPECVLYVL